MVRTRPGASEKSHTGSSEPLAAQDGAELEWAAREGGFLMKKSALPVVGAFLIGLVGPAVSQEGPPKAGPEHKKMAYFLGTWDFKGEAKAGPMGPGGPITFKETCDLFEGGFAVICRSEGKGPMGPTKSLSIMSYDTEKKAYTYTGVESNGPVFTALGKVEGGTWSWSSEGKMGTQVMKTKVTVKEAGPTTYEFRMEVSTNGGPFTPVMDGKSTKGGT